MPKQVIDQSKVGTRGYPRHWRALGLQPPMRDMTPDEIERERWRSLTPQQRAKENEARKLKAEKDRALGEAT